ncbi:ATP-dependent DNA helicase [Simiduia sp. 21SJ11W-1]|uniref:ATP-dependent DNA helicase n=1 Tax=Simiduia sp. 21SJ11W-1 TaxID=2909669 RepID=UPI0020A1186F|nr:ATP-dependent DNA helicase [Simiduia sp. 21SJ11W-1]UTA47193.1 ATP-dependent DNA helicase [Simiduia sp. 21SJ11W-1]
MSEQHEYCVSVRELCEFVAKCGDLDLRFTPSPTAQEGIALHQQVAARRRETYGEAYVVEWPLAGEYQGLRVRGRADGWAPEQARLEEVKSFRGALSKMRENQRALHWAQLKIYGHLACESEALEEITLALTYIDAADGSEHPFIEHWPAQALKAYWHQACEIFGQWAKAQAAHLSARNTSLAALQFPYKDFHGGQRVLAENVYQAVVSRRCLVAEAPTGIGKTLGTLFPALKAAPHWDKLLFLCAKTPGRRLALDGIAQLKTENLRSLELIAKEKACEHPTKACHGEDCPLAAGFYDKLPPAREAALAEPMLDAQTVRRVALAHQVCPYYLSQELCRWVDVIVGDYNYYFDQRALLYSLASLNDWRLCVLVDEAHNLIERARAMYSASITRRQLKAARKQGGAVIDAAITKFDKQWASLSKALAIGERKRLHIVPARWVLALNNLVYECNRLQLELKRPMPDAVQSLYFAALQMVKALEIADENFIVDVEKTGRGQAALNVRNVVPAPWLQPRFEQAPCVLFSATLRPQSFVRTLLGVPESAVDLVVASPFSGEQLNVVIERSISTRFKDRSQSLPKLVACVLNQYAREPGNYLVFFSSFAYLEQAQAALEEAARTRGLSVPLWAQTRGMAEAERAAFVAEFVPGGCGIGLAVLGGAFGEGIDLTGDRLVGAFIATLGMPQFNPVNEDIRTQLDSLVGQGYQYTYVYPGLQKVVQAAGRIIRTVEDRGVLYLLDDRFASPEVQALLPDWWQV